MGGKKHPTLILPTRPGLCLGWAAAVWLVALAAGAVHAAVPVRVVDTQVNPGDDPDITFDAEDAIMLSYRHPASSALKLAYVTCDAIVYETLYDAGNPGFSPSLVLDALGFPSVVHRTEGDGLGPDGLRYSLDGGDLLGLHTVAIPGGAYGTQPVYALDSVDRPYVAFRQADGTCGLALFDITSGQWVMSTLPPAPLGGPGRYVTVAVNHQDQPVVAYYDVQQDIVVATLTAGGWSFRGYAIGPLYEGSGLSLAFDSVDAPHVAVSRNDGLKVLRFNLLNVTVQTVTASYPVMLAPHAMALDTGNHIRLAFGDLSDGSCKVAMNDFGWTTMSIETSFVGSPPSLAISSQNRWAIAYYDGQKAQIKVAGPGVAVSTPGDFDCDNDVDGTDLAHLEACSTGPGVSQYDANCLNADFDGDSDIDVSDFGTFQRCISGSDVPGNPHCAD